MVNAVRVMSSPDSDSVDSKNTEVNSVSAVDRSMSTSTTISALLLVMYFRMAIRVGRMVVLNSSLVALKDSCMKTAGVAGGIVVAGVGVSVGSSETVAVAVVVVPTVDMYGIKESSPEPKPLPGNSNVTVGRRIITSKLSCKTYVLTRRGALAIYSCHSK